MSKDTRRARYVCQVCIISLSLHDYTCWFILPTIPCVYMYRKISSFFVCIFRFFITVTGINGWCARSWCNNHFTIFERKNLAAFHILQWRFFVSLASTWFKQKWWKIWNELFIVDKWWRNVINTSNKIWFSCVIVVYWRVSLSKFNLSQYFTSLYSKYMHLVHRTCLIRKSLV